MHFSDCIRIQFSMKSCSYIQSTSNKHRQLPKTQSKMNYTDIDDEKRRKVIGAVEWVQICSSLVQVDVFVAVFSA